MSPMSPLRHPVMACLRPGMLLVLAYAALVSETTVTGQLQPAGATLQPLWLVLAIAVACCTRTTAMTWAALLGFLADCLDSSGPLGLQLVLAVLFVALLPSSWIRRSTRSPWTWAVLVFVLVGSIETASLLLLTRPHGGGIPVGVLTACSDSLLTAVVGLAGYLLGRSLLGLFGHLLHPAPLAH